ncbi:MAG TPA: hypothetical protein DCS19_01725 [Flavobacterium sp.]|nr:hypothetical protein [Flavobacterium sp.]
MEAILINIDEIEVNPINSSIYGEPDIDESFKESIAKFGILEPLHVVESKLPYPDVEKRYTLLSGHRRLKAAQLNNIAELPCIIDSAPNRDFCDYLLLAFNLQRVKNEAIKGREYSEYKQKLSHLSQLKMLKGVNFTANDVDNAVFALTEKLGINLDKPLKIPQSIAKHLGISYEKAEMLATIMSNDIAQSFVDAVTQVGGSPKKANELVQFWMDSQKALENGTQAGTVYNELIEKIKAIFKPLGYDFYRNTLMPIKVIKERKKEANPTKEDAKQLTIDYPSYVRKDDKNTVPKGSEYVFNADGEKYLVDVEILLEKIQEKNLWKKLL